MSGTSLLPGFKIKLAIEESPAPPPIIIALPSPAAVPANFGLTDIIAAVELGMDIPFPSPTRVIKPKNEKTEPSAR